MNLSKEVDAAVVSPSPALIIDRHEVMQHLRLLARYHLSVAQSPPATSETTNAT